MPRASQTRIMRTPLFGDCDDCDVDDAGETEGAGDVEVAGVDTFIPDPDPDTPAVRLVELLTLGGCSLCSKDW